MVTNINGENCLFYKTHPRSMQRVTYTFQRLNPGGGHPSSIRVNVFRGPLTTTHKRWVTVSQETPTPRHSNDSRFLGSYLRLVGVRKRILFVHRSSEGLRVIIQYRHTTKYVGGLQMWIVDVLRSVNLMSFLIVFQRRESLECHISTFVRVNYSDLNLCLWPMQTVWRHHSGDTVDRN